MSTSKTPPSVSSPSVPGRSRRPSPATSASAHRTGERSTASASAGSGGLAGARTFPIRTTWDTMWTPSAPRNALQTAPAATRAAVSRALARSRTLRTSSNPYFCAPTRSACPGRGRVSASPGSGGPSALISSRYFCSNSTFVIVTATGEPIVRLDARPPGSRTYRPRSSPAAAPVSVPASRHPCDRLRGSARPPEPVEHRRETSAVRLGGQQAACGPFWHRHPAARGGRCEGGPVGTAPAAGDRSPVGGPPEPARERLLLLGRGAEREGLVPEQERGAVTGDRPQLVTAARPEALAHRDVVNRAVDLDLRESARSRGRCPAAPPDARRPTATTRCPLRRRRLEVDDDGARSRSRSPSGHRSTSCCWRSPPRTRRASRRGRAREQRDRLGAVVGVLLASCSAVESPPAVERRSASCRRRRSAVNSNRPTSSTPTITPPMISVRRSRLTAASTSPPRRFRGGGAVPASAPAPSPARRSSRQNVFTVADIVRAGSRSSDRRARASGSSPRRRAAASRCCATNCVMSKYDRSR